MVGNNLWGEVVHADLPALNGRLHVLGRLLLVPYLPVHSVLEARPDTRCVCVCVCVCV